jgi:hypothetical protein
VSPDLHRAECPPSAEPGSQASLARRREFEELLPTLWLGNGLRRQILIRRLAEFAPWSLVTLEELIEDRDEGIRISATEALGEIAAPEAAELLCRAFGDSSRFVRSAAVQLLARHPSPRALDALCGSLGDAREVVRAGAAEALGLRGDPEAVPPLTEALRACFVGRSARWQVLAGIGVVVGTALFVVAWILGSFAVSGFAVASFFVVQFVWRRMSAYVDRRRSAGRVCRAITEALARSAEQSPSPELRNVLPELRVVASDVLQQDQDTRSASRATAAKIEALTEKLKSLPLPASGQAPDAETLPRAGTAPGEEQVHESVSANQ